ncbi:hypothetical protein DRO69_05775 [Candidatus Bathyarchaeota archaeon]|nr:MAG: hypothetical protein DRO69_05775 [Candidatus Bathyarchaeota archaeon]
MAESFRKELRSRVRSLWTSDGFEIQEALKEKGRALLKAGYRKCAEEVPGKDYPACLRKVASEKNISREYRSIWGTV